MSEALRALVQHVRQLQEDARQTVDSLGRTQAELVKGKTVIYPVDGKGALMPKRVYVGGLVYDEYAGVNPEDFTRFLQEKGSWKEGNKITVNQVDLDEFLKTQPRLECQQAKAGSAARDNPLKKKLAEVWESLGRPKANEHVLERLRELAEEGDPIIQEISNKKEIFWCWPGRGEREKPVSYGAFRAYMSKIRKQSVSKK